MRRTTIEDREVFPRVGGLKCGRYVGLNKTEASRQQNDAATAERQKTKGVLRKTGPDLCRSVSSLSASRRLLEQGKETRGDEAIVSI